jgi:hypothetical protein
MLPIGLLIREHRLIERMVKSLRVEEEKIKLRRLDPVCIDQAVASSEHTQIGPTMARRRTYSSVAFRQRT